MPDLIVPRPRGRKFGRKPPHLESTHPRMHARNVVRSEYTGSVPKSVDWSTGLAFPLFMNDDLGDCTIADVGHAVEIFSTCGQGHLATVTDSDVLAMYERVGGYRPGDPSTDQGCVIQDVLNDWRKTGICSPAHKILAFFQVNHRDLAEVKACTWLFGGVTLGVNLPQSALDQHDNGQIWDYTPRADNVIVGGHDVRIVAVHADGTMDAVTWGTLQRLTPAWLARFADEAWAQADAAWARSADTPDGLNYAALNAAFAQLTRQPGPFPAPGPPNPLPSPPNPSPLPVVPPTASAADQSLAAAIPAAWLAHPHWQFQSTSKVASALETWLAVNGLKPTAS